MAPDFQAYRPRWSPDGRSILIVGRDEKQKQESNEGGIYQAEVADGRVTPVVLFAKPQQSASAFCWARDGMFIVYNGRGCLRMRELKSGKEKELYCHPNFGRILTLSPDGTTLGFSTTETQSNTASLQLMSVDGGEPRKLLTAMGEVGNLVWTPDGGHLLYTNLQNNFEVLHRISRNGGSPEEVWRSPTPRPSGLKGLSFRPDGRQAAISTYMQETEIMVMQNVHRK